MYSGGKIRFFFLLDENIIEVIEKLCKNQNLRAPTEEKATLL